MEKFQLLREEALKNYKVADHMLNVTYPLIQDTKILVGITDNLFLSLNLAVSSILHHERIFKLVPAFNDESFENKFHTLQQKKEKYEIDQEYFELMLDLKETLQLHKSSPVEFRSKDRFVICTNNYKVKAITANQLKIFLKKTREFLDLMNQITSRKQRLFDQNE